MQIKEWNEKILDLENIIIKDLLPTFVLSKRMHGAQKKITELIFYHQKENYYITIGFIRRLKEENLCRIQVIQRRKYGINEKLKKKFINIDDKIGILKTVHSYKKEIELAELFRL
jgi:exonuclease I